MQLVVANGPTTHLSTFEYNNNNNKIDLNDNLKSNQMKSFKSVKENNNNERIIITKDKADNQFNGQYTSINAIRTNALKHTQVEFQRLSS